MHALAYVGLAVVFLLGSLPRSATADQVSVNLPHVQVHLLVLDIFAFGTLLNLGVLPEAALHPGFFLFYTLCLESEAGLIVVTCPCCSVAK